jgi:hypothetical protein
LDVEKGELLHIAVGNVNFVQSLWKTVWKLIKKLKIERPYDLAIPLLGIYPKEIKSAHKSIACMPMFIVALLTIAKIWNQSMCPSANEWVKKIWHTHNGI